MRIAVVTPEFPPDAIGGGGVVVQALVQHYAGEHLTEVFSADHVHLSWAGKRTQDQMASGGATAVRRFPLIPLGSSRDALRTVLPPNPRALGNLFADLRTFRPDAAHLHGCGYAIVDLVARWLRMTNTPYVLTDHGLPQSPAVESELLRRAYSAYERSILAGTVRQARGFTAVSHDEANLCERRLGRRAVVIPNAVEVPNPLPEPSPAVSDALERAAGRPLIASAGRLTPTKGFDVLARAMAAGVNSDAVCLIAGHTSEASYLADLTAQCDGRTILLGGVDRNDVLALFGQADVVAVPSRHEPFGLVALEALACGSRVVASAVGGLTDFLVPPLGHLVPSGDVPALSAALNAALARGRLDEGEQERTERLVRSHSWAEIGSRYLALLSSSGTGAGPL